jgi:putative DNA primase/helicase
MTDHLEQVKQRFDAAEDIAPVDGLSVPGPDQDMSEPPAPRTPDGDIPIEAQGAAFPENDTGNGQRFNLYYGEDAIMVPRVGWFLWDGKRWQQDHDMIAVRGKAQQVQDHIIAEIPHMGLEDWQLRELEAEVATRAALAPLEALERDARTPEQQVEYEDLHQKLVWIGKIKERKSKMKSEHRSFAKTSGNNGRITAMLTESTVHLAREVDDLDSDPLTVNTESGVLRFSVTGGTGEGFSRVADVVLEPHVREATVTGHNAPQYITKMLPVEYDPAATCPGFDEFLERIQPNRDMRAFLQRWFGLSMTSLTGEQKFAFLYGDGANGKSVLVDLVARMFGDYSATAKIESLTGRNRRGGGDATPDLIPLVGARMVRASEPEEGERLKEGMIKELTGGEPILVRQLHSDFVEVKPKFKLTISGNHKPDIRGTDDGIWRRVLLVPFDVKIPQAERNEKLGDELFDRERAGILNWLVTGLLDYLEGGLQEPQQVLDATLEYRSESDPIGSYLKECCIVTGHPSDFTTARDLMDGFNLWLDLKGEGMWGSRTVSLKLKQLAGRYRDPATGKVYTTAKQRVTGYRGIRFQDMFRKDFDDAPRNAQGHPVASTSRSASSGGGDGDFL